MYLLHIISVATACTTSIRHRPPPPPPSATVASACRRSRCLPWSPRLGRLHPPREPPHPRGRPATFASIRQESRPIGHGRVHPPLEPPSDTAASIQSRPHPSAAGAAARHGCLHSPRLSPTAFIRHSRFHLHPTREPPSATAASIRRDNQEDNRSSWNVFRGKVMHVTAFEYPLEAAFCI